MFGLSTIQLYITLGLVALLAGAGIYIKILRQDVAIEKLNVATVQSAYDAEKEKNDQMGKDLAAQHATNTVLSQDFQKANDEKLALEKQLQATISQLKAQALKDPKAVEVKINTTSTDSLRCNELVTGSVLTDDEKSGKTKNSVCQTTLDRIRGSKNE